MTTAIEFESSGVRFETVAGETSVFGPDGNAGLLDELRAAVTARVDGYGRRKHKGLRCVFCGDPMRRGGDCYLCRLAGQRLTSAQRRAMQTGEVF